MLNITVLSDRFDGSQDEISIVNYTVTDINDRKMDIQINFYKPTKISEDVIEPEKLLIQFNNGQLFIDKKDYMRLPQSFELVIELQP